MRGRGVLLACLLSAMACSSTTSSNQASTVASGEAPVLFEGATLIVGDTSSPIESSAFIVEGGRIGRGFSNDQAQTFFYTSDVGSGTVWILNRTTGRVVNGIGSMGHHAGQFVGVHTTAVDSKGNLYVSEGGGGRRSQKFVTQ